MNNCTSRCQNATGYRCRCSCNGLTHGSVSSLVARKRSPALSADTRPTSRSYLKGTAKASPTPLLKAPPTHRQLDFTKIAALWPEPDTAWVA